MSEQEREATREASEDVEAHIKRRSEESEPPEEGAGARREGEDPDVEAHIKR
jgi:hypothetical protein